MAWVVDVLIRFVILLFVLFFLSSFTQGSNSVGVMSGIILIVQFLLAWLYTTLFEALTGATPGKKLFCLRVIHDNGTPLSGAGAIIRNFLRAVDGLPFMNAVGLVSMLIDNRFRRLGDLAANTLVIYRYSADVLQPTASKDRAALPAEYLTAPPASLNREDRKAVVDFAERSDSLSEQRQLELAKLLEHHMEDASDPIATVIGWAYWVLGGQQQKLPDQHAQSKVV